MLENIQIRVRYINYICSYFLNSSSDLLPDFDLYLKSSKYQCIRKYVPHHPMKEVD